MLTSVEITRQPIALLNALVADPDLCLIDDDELVRESWKLMALHQKLSIATFSTYEEFISANISKSVPVYFDNRFFGVERGIEIAAKLNQSGFSDIHLVSGEHEKFNNKKLPFVYSISGKNFPIVPNSNNLQQ